MSSRVERKAAARAARLAAEADAAGTPRGSGR